MFSPHLYGDGWLLLKKCLSLGRTVKAQTTVSVTEWAHLLLLSTPCTPRGCPGHRYFMLFPNKSLTVLPDKAKFSISLKRKNSWDVRKTLIRDWLPDS